ncbi:hypothetical protein L484_024246 [Morus notabilis]|uniref:Uncharacterized protein n=1 Tax=Morus notabilis TaxID=981085 RepID=W9QH24_9ROSA|nr:hypothetical protein L484_024246 [Morus notabilis]
MDFWLSFLAVMNTFVYLTNVNESIKSTIHTIAAIITALLAVRLSCNLSNQVKQYPHCFLTGSYRTSHWVADGVVQKKNVIFILSNNPGTNPSQGNGKSSNLLEVAQVTK